MVHAGNVGCASTKSCNFFIEIIEYNCENAMMDILPHAVTKGIVFVCGVFLVILGQSLTDMQRYPFSFNARK